MWRQQARRMDARLALGAIAAFVLLGAASPFKKSEKPPKVEESVTNIASIFTSTHNNMRLEGIGLVWGLDDTGKDAPPSIYRERLVDMMQKAGIEHPDKMLADPSVSIVLVHLKIPTGTSKNDRLDVELELPPGCGTTSLAGGVLLETRLKEVALAGGTLREGQELALARGPVIVGTDAKPDDLRVGRVLGGAVVKRDSPFRLEIKENRRSFKTARLLEQVVNQRFHQTEGIKQTGMAVAKTDGFLELRVPKVYKHNQYRYFRVIKLLPVVDNPQLRQARIAAWGEELLDPTKAGIAALRLEGIGPMAIETLKRGLSHQNNQVKFFSAEALAYLNDDSGVEILAEYAEKEPEFRAFALAALAATDQSAARMKLIKLMDVAEVPVRYGAFNALRTLDETDPFLGRVQVIDQPVVEEEEDESMSMAIAPRHRSKPERREDPFALYIVDSEGPPLVHLASTKRSEIVVFGRGQKLLTPAVLGAGPLLLNASDNDESIQISRISDGGGAGSDQKVQASLALGDIIRRAANLGAMYPDVVMILQAAARQKNLAGPLVVDAIPGPTKEYEHAALLGVDTTKKDSDLEKASAESTQKRPRFFGLFSRNKKKANDKEPETPKADASADSPTSDSATAEAAKADDGVKPASLETPSKPSFFDRFRAKSAK